MNSYFNANNASQEPDDARGISRTMIVMMIAKMASIKASNLSVSIFTLPCKPGNQNP